MSTGTRNAALPAVLAAFLVCVIVADLASQTAALIPIWTGGKYTFPFLGPSLSIANNVLDVAPISGTAGGLLYNLNGKPASAKCTYDPATSAITCPGLFQVTGAQQSIVNIPRPPAGSVTCVFDAGALACVDSAGSITRTQ